MAIPRFGKPVVEPFCMMRLIIFIFVARTSLRTLLQALKFSTLHALAKVSWQVIRDNLDNKYIVLKGDRKYSKVLKIAQKYQKS